MTTWQGVQRRIDRLGQLAMGLQFDRGTVFEARHLLTAEERLAYVKAMKDADRALEEARTALYAAQLRRDGAG
jgi:hypothetical protein